jgi:hypothetical protein
LMELDQVMFRDMNHDGMIDFAAQRKDLSRNTLTYSSISVNLFIISE